MIDRGTLFLWFWIVLFGGALGFALVGIVIAF